MDGAAKTGENDMDGSVTLPMANGPDCPRCGCRDCHIKQQPLPGRTWYPTGRARCKHCGMFFAFRELPTPHNAPVPVIDCSPVQLPPHDIQSPIPFSTRVDVVLPSVSILIDPAKCPDCGSVAKAYSTKGRTQYRRCPDCGKRFKTMKDAG